MHYKKLGLKPKRKTKIETIKNSSLDIMVVALTTDVKGG